MSIQINGWEDLPEGALLKHAVRSQFFEGVIGQVGGDDEAAAAQIGLLQAGVVDSVRFQQLPAEVHPEICHGLVLFWIHFDACQHSLKLVYFPP